MILRRLRMMKMKVEFKDHDEYDVLIVDLVRLAHEAVDQTKYHDAELFLTLLITLLKGEIVEA